MQAGIALNPDLDIAAHAQAVAAMGRTRIPNLLDDASARLILSLLEKEPQWSLVTHLEGRHRVIDAAGFDAQPPARRQPLFDLVHQTARRNFGYLFENVPLYDLWHSRAMPDHPMLSVVDFVRSDPFLGLARRLTGRADIAFADAQATRYRSGHFLTTHDDDAHGKNRRAAYVLNLTPDWNPDWGGQLLFFDEEGNVTGGFTPGFNTLNIFLVPVRHSVAYVAPFADRPRYAITGWLRAGADPGPG